MKKNGLTIYFIVFHLFFIFMQIYKKNLFIECLYKKQKIEKEKQALLEKKAILIRKKYILKTPASVKQFAQKILGMHRINFSQVKYLKS